jgi:hypothetical protein
VEEDSQNYIVEKADDELYDLIEYEESEPMPEDEDGMLPLHFQDEYYEDDNNYYSGQDNTKKH